MKPPYDIKNDPKFKARVKKIEANQCVKVLKKPLLVNIPSGLEAYVVAIGINDSYLIVLPTPGICSFELHWTKSDGFSKPTAHHEAIVNQVVSWIMLYSSESDFIKVKHGAYDIKKLAMDAIVKTKGKKFFEVPDKTLGVYVQGSPVEINNPYCTR